MTKIVLSLVFLFFFHQNSSAQTPDVDTRAASIPAASCTSVNAMVSFIKGNFATDADRTRAIYVWTTHHINYDVALFLAREKRPDNQPLPTVANILASRKAVCQGYSELFVEVCRGLGINAIVVPGYTKNQGGLNPVSHAWVAASLDNEWYLFDPTWGAGYVKDEQFVRKFNNTFYKVLPADFIADHMPFDPMYQFLSYPLSHNQFADGTPADNKVLFHFKDSLKQYSQLSSIQQNASELRRLEAAGIKTDLLQKRQNFLKMRLENFASKNAFDEGSKTFNTVVGWYNEYIAHKNKQFSAIKDTELRQLIDRMEQNTKRSRSLILETKPQTDDQNKAKVNSVAEIDRFWTQLSKEKQFAEKYLVTDMGMRKQLFIRR